MRDLHLAILAEMFLVYALAAWSRSLRTLVVMKLVTQASWITRRLELGFYRDGAQREVDIVIGDRISAGAPTGALDTELIDQAGLTAPIIRL